MKRIAIIKLTVVLLASAAYAQKAESPTAAVVRFYHALKEKRYVDGFRKSVYRAAVEGLSQAEMQDLEPDFLRTFSAIPDKIEARGENVVGDTAVVFLKFGGVDQPQQVSLIRINGEWLIGDKETLEVVRTQGRSFFFNARMLVNEDEAYDLMSRIVGAEVIYSQRFQKCAPLAELIRLGGVPKEIEAEVASGYKFSLTLGQDQKTFVALATPAVYGKTGRLSFYADANGVRAADLKGKPASEKSPFFQPRRM